MEAHKVQSAQSVGVGQLIVFPDNQVASDALQVFQPGYGGQLGVDPKAKGGANDSASAQGPREKQESYTDLFG